MAWRFQVYGVVSEKEITAMSQIKWYLTPMLQVDQVFWANHNPQTNETEVTNSHSNSGEKLLVVSPPVSIGHAKALIECLQQDSSHKKSFFFRSFMSKVLRDNSHNDSLEQTIMSCLQKLGIEDFEHNYEDLIDLKGIKGNELRNELTELEARYEGWWQKIAHAYHGKLLLQEELEKHLSSINRESTKQKSHNNKQMYQNNNEEFSLKDLAVILQLGYLKGDVVWDSAVSYPSVEAGSFGSKQQSLVCHRCGSTEKVYIRECASCGEACATCEQCITMGRSKTCAPLIEFGSKQPSSSPMVAVTSPSLTSQLALSFSLTQAQQNISDQIVDFIKSKQEQDMLVWAVTGAGKTEMIFYGIDRALSQGKKVLLATPRKDVVRELTPRFAQAFPNTTIVSLYGGSSDKWKNGDLYLATTHQTMRFSSFFDIIFIDELDAFPYHNDPMLAYVVKRALKPDGQMIYMTATPSVELQKRVDRNEVKAAILPLRYHGNPLPVPELKLMPKKETILKQTKAIPEIVDFFQQVIEQEGQAFIFVPMVKDVPIWTAKLRKWFPEFQGKIEGVYAADKERDQKVMQFRQGKITFMVTTTIMERGVTVPNVHVLVIGAESRVFDEATLVQIAGRVGRSSLYPAGIVTFLAEYNKRDIIKANKQIQSMNLLGKQK